MVDLTTVMLGPYCTRILAEMGADVIKVEGLGGDDARWVGPARSAGMGATFQALNVGKRSLAIDLKDEGGREALDAVIGSCDVFVHSMRAPAARRLKIDYESIEAVNARVLYCAVHGFAPDGSRAGLPAYDDIVQASCGLAALQGRYGGTPPQYVASVVADKTVGLILLAGVLAGLYERERSGLGQAIDLPMFEAMVGFSLVEHLYGGAFEPAEGPVGYSRALSPHRRPFRTADGYIAVMPYHDLHWRSFFAAIGRPELADDERFSSIGSRTDHIDELYDIVAGALAGRISERWISVLREHDVPCAAVAEPEDLLADPDLRQRGVIGAGEHPTEGAIRTLPTQIKFSRTALSDECWAPRLGADSIDVLAGAGLTDERVRELLDRGVVGDGASS